MLFCRTKTIPNLPCEWHNLFRCSVVLSTDFIKCHQQSRFLGYMKLVSRFHCDTCTTIYIYSVYIICISQYTYQRVKPTKRPMLLRYTKWVSRYCISRESPYIFGIYHTRIYTHRLVKNHYSDFLFLSRVFIQFWMIVRKCTR